ncbi:MAG: hypothetical protein ACM3US_04165 [Sphingomonadaceae bacterium]
MARTTKATQVEEKTEAQDVTSEPTATVEGQSETVETQTQPTGVQTETSKQVKVLTVLTVKNWFSAGYSKGQRGMTKVAPSTPEGTDKALTEKLQAAWLRGYDAGTKKPAVRNGRQPLPPVVRLERISQELSEVQGVEGPAASLLNKARTQLTKALEALKAEEPKTEEANG